MKHNINNGVSTITMPPDNKNLKNKYNQLGITRSYKDNYRAEISVDNKKYHLGLYKLDEALKIRKEAEKHVKDGTFHDWYKAKKFNVKNQYGVKGLSPSITKGKYDLNINYKKKRYYVGKFESIEDAAKIRSIADEHIKNDTFVEWIVEYKTVRGNEQ